MGDVVIEKGDIVKRLRSRGRLKDALGWTHDSITDEAADEIDRLRAKVEKLSVIRCPDGKMHQWDGDGQCRNCCNYATDLIDKALRGEGE